MTVDTITLTARRVLRRLTHARREAIEAEHQFLEADRSICPELWDRYHEESRFRSTSCTTEDRFLLAVARRFDLDPDMLDAAVLEADWEEQGRMAARSIASAGVCAYHLRGLECRNAPMNERRLT